jgi:hypothetical protein
MLPPCSGGGMARTLKDANLDKPEARSRLAARGKPHYRLIEPGLHLGDRKARGRKGKPAVAGNTGATLCSRNAALVTQTSAMARFKPESFHHRRVLRGSSN